MCVVRRRLEALLLINFVNQRIRVECESHCMPKQSLMTPLYQSAVERVTTEYQALAKSGKLDFKNPFTLAN